MNLAQMELAFLACTFFREFPEATLHSSMTDADMEIVDLFVNALRGDTCVIIAKKE